MSNSIISKTNSKKYSWGENCKTWVLFDDDRLSLKEECMPAGTKELLHCHDKQKQYFYILNGVAKITIDGEAFILEKGECISIEPGQEHYISNHQSEDLHFLLVTNPNLSNDRTNIE